MRYFLIIYFFFTSCLVFAQDKDIYELIAKRIHEHQLSDVSNIKELDQKIASYLEVLDTTTGKYTDVDYFDHKRINVSWLPVLERMRLMTIAYTHPKSSYFKNDNLHLLIAKSLSYFSTHKPLPYCDNWYQQGIRRPQSLALSLINLKFGAKPIANSTFQSTLNAACRDTAINSANRNNPMHKWNSGANKTETALGWIYLSALLKKEDMLRVAVRETFSPITLTTGEGIQYDFSYDMHHGYLYNGAYGYTFVRNVIDVANYVKNTSYALSGSQLELFSTYFKEGVLGVQRGNWLDWNVVGRGISRNNIVYNDIRSVLEKMILIDTSSADLYRLAIKERSKNPLPYKDSNSSNRNFWHTDFTVHRRPNYYFSVHAVSSRNHAQEIGNLENLKGYWGAQGTMNLMLNGDEYYNVFPLWDWTKLPGTTLPDTLVVGQNKSVGFSDRKGTSKFVGGISDSTYGVKTYVVEDELGVSYKKAWFMLDNEIVCLGAGITSILPKNNIYTTVNQVISNERKASYGNFNKSKISTLNNDFITDNIDYVIHDNVAYLVEEKPEVNIELTKKQAKWSEITGSGSLEFQQTELEKDIFYLGINHGIKPVNSKYAYRIVPQIEHNQNIARLKKGLSIIVSNTENMQAVYDPMTNLHQVIIYKADQSYSCQNVTIKSDKPCVVMLRIKKNGEAELYASDPSQLLTTLSLNIGVKNKLVTYNVDLPKGNYAGSTKRIIVE